MLSRFFSLCLAGIYIYAAAQGEQAQILRVLMFLVLPLGCIWFGDALGGYTGATRSGPIDTPTPGFLVRAGGWLLLSIPLVMAIYHALKTPGLETDAP